MSVRGDDQGQQTRQEFLTIREVAARLRVSAACIYQLVESGRLPHHRIGSGRGAIRVSECDLAEFLRECRRESPPGEQRPPRRTRMTLKHIKL